MKTLTFGVRTGVGLGIIALFAMGCTESGAPKAWSELMNCTLGSQGAAADSVGRQAQLRLLQLGNPGTDGKPDAWPGRCTAYANDLYAALESSGNQASLKRSLQSKLGCSEDKKSCVLNQETLPLLLGELANGAKAAELKLIPVVGVKTPEVSLKLSLSAADWKPIQKQPAQIAGPEVTATGDVHWLLKATGERSRPTGCSYSPKGQKLDCFAASEKTPALPPQSIQLVSNATELIAAGLTETGLAAFNLKTGEPVVVKGVAGNLKSDGLAVEKGEGDKGFVAIALQKGKAAKPIDLKSKATITQPMSLGSQIVWLEPGENNAKLAVRTVKGGRIVEVANLTGAFNGTLHTCASASTTAVGVWAAHAGQRVAKPTSGSDMTQVTIALQGEGGWSKSVEAKIPFRRAVESELSCEHGIVAMAWVEPTEGGVKVGRLTCDANGCKTAEATLPGIESRWWWAVGPVGDQVLLMWRANLGEARMRLAPLTQLEQTKDVVLFDDQDHGGPTAGEAVAVFSNEGALLLFKNEAPVALSIAKDGNVRVLSAP